MYSTKTVWISFAILLSTFSASAQSTSLSYSGYLRGFKVMQLDLSFSFQKSRYEIYSKARTIGLAALASPQETETHILGKIKANGLETLQFSRIEKNSGSANFINGEKVRLENPDGQVIEKTRPSDAAGSVDPMSAIAHALWRTQARGECTDNRIVYDGRVLSKASFSSLPQEQLSENSRQRIAGTALKCQILVEELEEQKKSSVPRVDLWIAPLETTQLYIPLKMLWIIDGEQAMFYLNSFE